MKKKFLWLSAILLMVISCNPDGNDNSPGTYAGGYFVLNEGPFGSGTGTITYYNSTFSSTTQNVYELVNGEPLGNIVQSAFIVGDLMYIVVNNANKIVVVNRYTMQKISEITSGLSNPRYCIVVNNKVYTTNWGTLSSSTDDKVTVHQANDGVLITSISVPEGPERIALMGDKAYVLVKGVLNQNNKLLRINLSNNTIENTFTIGWQPDSFYVRNNILTILCSGKFTYDSSWNIIPQEDAQIWRLQSWSSSPVKINDFSDTTSQIELAYDLSYWNGQHYMRIGGKVMRLPDGAPSTTGAVEFLNENFYRLQSINGLIIGLDAGNFTSNGQAKIYNSSGTLLHTLTTGIIPTEVVYNF